jgi:hypothetical protein
LVFITEMKSVYSAVRTGSLNKAVCASSLNGYLITNSDLCHLQHKLIGFYNRDLKCLLRGTVWVFKKAVCAASLNGQRGARRGWDDTKLQLKYDGGC